jgi:hypothetical protein
MAEPFSAQHSRSTEGGEIRRVFDYKWNLLNKYFKAVDFREEGFRQTKTLFKRNDAPPWQKC